MSNTNEPELSGLNNRNVSPIPSGFCVHVARFRVGWMNVPDASPGVMSMAPPNRLTAPGAPASAATRPGEGPVKDHATLTRSDAYCLTVQP